MADNKITPPGNPSTLTEGTQSALMQKIIQPDMNKGMPSANMTPVPAPSPAPAAAPAPAPTPADPSK
jgi:hypothetical protein